MMQIKKFKKYRINIKCDFCKKWITKNLKVYKRSKHHFCSVECHFKFSLKLKVNCDNCGKVLYLYPYKKKKKKGKHYFCNHICFQNFRHKNSLEEIKCSTCKNKFSIKKIRKKRQKRFFCCRACFNKFQREVRSKLVICLECKKIFRIPLGLLKSGRGKFCNKKCFVQYMRKRQYKEFFF
jgi:hypothetical protein